MVPAKLRALTVSVAVALGLAGAGSAGAAGSDDNAASPVGAGSQAAVRVSDAPLVQDFSAADRNTAWQLTGRLKLNFPTYHTEGLVVAGDRRFLSAVQIIAPTVRYPTPQGGYDRTPGRGVGHVFVLDRQGNLLRDITLGEGHVYHPGGMDFDGQSVWVPVAQYRPNSSAIIYRIDPSTLSVREQFRVGDHIGGIVRDQVSGHLIGNNWGSRRFYEWTSTGRALASWDNPSHFIDYQDCQYAPSRKMICGGITNLPHTPTAGGSGASYELGGIALTDLREHTILHEVPLQLWSTAGHVITRNPLKLAADGNQLTMWVAPDNGDEGNGTELLTYKATVAATQERTRAAR
jgi:hypothetical protein